MNSDKYHDLVIDVGANNGDFFIPIYSENKNILFLAYEPIPELMNNLKAKVSGKKNVILRQVALSNECGTGILNISNASDWGVSSLLEFNSENIDNNLYWKERSDLHFTSHIEVKITSLESELDGIRFDRIRFIKIDSQGLDVEILSSLGRYIDKVDAGMLEVPSSLSQSLYNGEKYDLRKALNYLNQNNFHIYKIKPNDECCNEFNVFFKRKDIDITILENELELCKTTIYNGKDYWHMPSMELTDYPTKLHQMNTMIHELKTQVHSLKTEIHRCMTDNVELNEMLKDILSK
uniref:Glycosyltransferase n=1 Tax=Aeromonas hydrophila TaxID=644 RepID=A0A346ACA1_AERHY|nr:glycosyltransferase [Aeromonas hydrophila]